jgi:DNA-binding transcriptional MocR family regulator
LNRLPAIREYAEASGCSKNTVISAFEMLTASGLIEPRRGSGFHVARQVKAVTETDEARVLDRAMGTVWLMREQLQVKPAVFNFGEGFAPIDWLEGTRRDQYHQRIARTGVASLFRYGSRYEIDVHLLAQRVVRRVFYRREVGVARIVHQHVETAELLHGETDGAARRDRIGDVQ